VAFIDDCANIFMPSKIMYLLLAYLH